MAAQQQRPCHSRVIRLALHVTLESQETQASTSATLARSLTVRITYRRAGRDVHPGEHVGAGFHDPLGCCYLLVGKLHGVKDYHYFY